jgi:hypothetical protein
MASKRLLKRKKQVKEKDFQETLQQILEENDFENDDEFPQQESNQEKIKTKPVETEDQTFEEEFRALNKVKKVEDGINNEVN